MNVEGRAQQKGIVYVMKQEPCTVMGDLIEHRSDTRLDPATRRALIAAKARNNPKEQFNNLMHHLSPDLVAENLNKMSKTSAPGYDGMTVTQAQANLSWLLPPLLNQINKGRYLAPPVRRVLIPKADGKEHPIGVPQVLDRGIQGAMAQILNEIYEQDFLPCSFGFRPGLGCHNAVATINEVIGKSNLNYALEVDIRDFFGSLSHEWLRKFLELRIGDQRILRLISSWLKAGVMDRNVWQATEVGTPQGGSISPLLANIYLHYVLDLWFDKKIKSQLRGDARLVRYADDFIILFENPDDIDAVKLLLKARLEQFGLAISEAKTHTTDLTPHRNGGNHKRRHITFLGFSIFRAKNRSQTGYKTVFQTETNRFTRSKNAMQEKLKKMMHWDLEIQANRLNAILRGHFNYYGLAGNMHKLLNFQYETIRYWRYCLSKRSQTGGINWPDFQKVLNQYPLISPQLKIPYSKLALYVRL